VTLAPQLLEIEEQALAGWPAAEVEALAGWQLRAMSGVSRRANSVWTARAQGLLPLETRIAQAESFYRERGLPPSFQISAHSEPAGLDAALAARGYLIDSPVSVQVARAQVAASVPPALDVRAEVAPQMSDLWFELSARRGRFASVQDVYRGLLTRLGPRALFAMAFVGGSPAAVGLGVRGERWLGISSMFTLPEQRGRGAARAILRALAAHAEARDDPSLYLQVEQSNLAALALYAQMGFVHHHGYHYRLGAERKGPP
jgi:GNAT superfamily N-acetyltransferase